jgi:outer membrane protein assembly factor BamA
VGPKGGGDAIGGRSLFQATLEYDVPIIPNFKGTVFVDMASVDEDAYALSDEVGVSVGPGMKIKTPVGPMAFYWGFPIVNKDDKNELGRFEFSLSRGF